MMEQMKADEAESAARIEKFEQHFNSLKPQFRFEKLLGKGSFGAAFRVIETFENGGTRRLCVKRALLKRYDKDVLKEIDYLRDLRGSMHIVDLIAWRGDPPSATADLPDYGWNNGYFLIGILGPVLVTEYMQNGTVLGFIEKLVKLKLELPNRVLWSFFLCLVRACIALAYPMKLHMGRPLQLEEVPVGDPRPARLVHGDLHDENVMIGETNPEVAEHNLAPILKFIDFGAAEQAPEELSFRENLVAISELMIQLIERGTDFEPHDSLGLRKTTKELRKKHPNLDPKLRDTIASCVADTPPNLVDLLETASSAVAKPASSYASFGKKETDDAIRKLLQKVLRDAS